MPEDGRDCRTEDKSKPEHKPEALWIEQQTAKYLGVAPATLRSWRSKSKGPPWIAVGGAIRYRPADVDAWLEERKFHGARTQKAK